MTDNIIATCRLGGSHGLKGYLKLQPFSGSVEHLFNGEEVFYFKDKEIFSLVIEDIIGGEKPLVKFRDFSSKEDVRVLTGLVIYIDKSLAPKKEEGEYYTDDFINLSLLLSGDTVGRIIGIVDYTNPPLLIADTFWGEKIIPYKVGVFVNPPDLANKCIEVIMGEILL